MIKKIYDSNDLLAIIVSNDFKKTGPHFFTEDDLSQQLGYMQYPAGQVIIPHVHNPVPRKVDYTQEVLFIRSGKLRVDFYSKDRTYLESHELNAGDAILLIMGGHGFEVLEDVEMFEVKQGPYVGDSDKTRFSSVESKNIIIKS